VKFEIIKSKIFIYPGIGEIEVLLKRGINRKQLSELVEYLKENILSEGKRIFITYYFKPPKINSLPVAFTNF